MFVLITCRYNIKIIDVTFIGANREFFLFFFGLFDMNFYHYDCCIASQRRMKDFSGRGAN